jgi:alpha-mannosidase
MTQKISWSQFNKFPHHSFWWKGLDGTKILTHFLPEDTYNSQLKASTLIKAEKNFKDKAVSNNILSLFGIGDGGGGPNQEQIERGLRAKDLESCPKVIFSKAEDFFEELKLEADEFATWDGELYLELHRGNLTTQSYCKMMNRKIEFRLRNLELLYASSDLSNYPTQAIEKLWKILLINQFHDILPGSSINLVYKDTHREYKEMIQEINSLTQQWESKNAESDTSSITVLNSNTSDFNGLVEIPEKFKNEKSLSDGKNSYSVQNTNNKSYIAIKVPSLDKVILTKSANSPANLTTKKSTALKLRRSFSFA